MNKSAFFPVLVFFLSLVSCSSGKKVTGNNPELEQAIAADSWLFTADQVNPQPGGNRNLDAGYEVKCTRGKLQSYLPYYGRSYSGTGAYTNQRPLVYKTEEFTITKEKGKKNSWVIILRPAGVTEIREYRMTVFSNGTATLDVQLNTRTPISFSGRLEVSQ